MTRRDHVQRARERKKEWDAAHERRLEAERVRNKLLRYKRDQLGVCTKCGGERDDPNLKLCSKCRAVPQKWRRRHAEENRCSRCGRERDNPNKKTCSACQAYLKEWEKVRPKRPYKPKVKPKKYLLRVPYPAEVICAATY